MDTLRLHTLFLEKLDKLTNDERELFVEYLAKLGNSPVHIGGPTYYSPVTGVDAFKSGQNQAESV